MSRGGDATFCIIAGGKGERLGGVPKGLLEVEGRSILARLLDHRGLFAETLLISTNLEYAQCGLPRVADRMPGKGAPGGVLTALSAARTPWVVAVACDMPFIPRPVFELLLSQRSDETQGACFEAHGRLEPLLGLYRASLASRWAECLGDDPSFRELHATLGLTRLRQALLESVDPELKSIVSINAPEDLERWNVRLPSR